MLERRTHSYLNKASILHIDRRKEFKLKLLEKDSPQKEVHPKEGYFFDEKF